jgi:uncharacterized coiled-coil protein SlyX
MSFTYEQYDVLHNFISPVTGRILADFNYVLVGNKNGIAIPSPILIDIRLDLIALRKRYNSLVKGDIIIGHPNNELPNAQVLFNLENGYLYNTEGVVSINTLIPIGDLPDLPYKNIWIGDVTNRPVPQQRVEVDNLPTFLSSNPLNNFGLYGLYTGQFSVTSPLQAAQPSITQRIDLSNMPHLSRGKMLIGRINYIPPVITIDSIFPYVHVTGSLNWSPPGVPPGAGDAVPTEIGLNPGEIFIGDPSNPGEIMVSTTFPSSTLPNLTYKAIWRGDISNRPVEVFDLSTLESRMTSAESSIALLQSSITQIGVQIASLQFQLGLLDAALGALTLEVQAIATSVATLGATVFTLGLTVGALGVSVTALDARVTNLGNRTLDQIPYAVADVNLNGQKIVNLADPTGPLDAVNYQTLTTAIGSTINSVTGTVNQITANTVSGAVTLSLPSDVIISTSLAAGNLKLISNTLISTTTNTNIILDPNGTGNVDVNNHKIINLANPVNPLDAVNYQTLTTAITGTISSVTGTVNQVTANTVSGAVTLSLPSAVVISTSLTAGNMELIGNSLISTNTNGNITLNPNGTGSIDVNNHKIINLTNPVSAQDAVNLQTMQAAIAASGISSVTGTANQITATTLSGAVTLSLPSTVIVSTSIAAGNLGINSNILQSNNANGSISIAPNGSGNLLLIPSPSTGLVGIKGTPTYPLDVFGATRTQRLVGSTGVSVVAGATTITGTGRTIVNDGSEIGGSISLNTGTGITIAGTANPVITVSFATAMPSNNYSVLISPGNITVTGLPFYVLKTNMSQFTIRCNAVLANSTTYTINYHVIAN